MVPGWAVPFTIVPEYRKGSVDRHGNIQPFWMNVLVVDIGGTRVKCLVTGHHERRAFESGPKLTPKQMVAGVKKLTGDWKFDVVSLGYPGLVVHGRPAADPNNLGKGWTKFDFAAAFGRPVRIMNDAAMQALGSYKGGTMFFLGLGTGLGSALIADGVVVPIEMGQLGVGKNRGIFEDYVGKRGLKKFGRKKWTRYVGFLVDRLVAAFHPDDMVLGGGNAKKLKKVPPKCRMGSNANAFLGGFRLWEAERYHQPLSRPALVPGQSRKRRIV